MVVNWTNEEGSRFAPAMMASAAYAGDFTTDEILAKRDAAGTTVAEALDAIGYRGVEAVGTREIGAFVELHIEQGPILEAEGKTIGVVEGGQGIMWFDGIITGFESHAGTTPMPRRRDALLALSEFALAAERIALAQAPTAVATIGEAAILAPSRNVVPGRVPSPWTCATRAPRPSTSWRRAFRRPPRRLPAAGSSISRSTGSGGRSRCRSTPPSWRRSMRRRRASATQAAESSRGPAMMPATSPRKCPPR